MIHGLYAIVDPQRSRHPAISLTRELLAGGCRLIQLRCKSTPDRPQATEERWELARAIMECKRDYDFCFIINDDLELARELRTDGIHLGATDTPIATARAQLGRQAIIGYSAATTGMVGAVAAQDASADYIAFGAIFPTDTKGPDHPVQGIPLLRQMVQIVRVPVVAIGGIGRDNVDQVWQTGVAAVAMIKSLSMAPDPRAEASWYVQRLRPGKITNDQIPNTK